MDFIEAIKKGLEASKNYDRNLDQIIEVISEANKAICEKTGVLGGFILVKSNRNLSCTQAVMSIEIDKQHAFPIKLNTISGNYIANDIWDLKEVVHKILSHPNFGFYVRRLMENNK